MVSEALWRCHAVLLNLPDCLSHHPPFIFSSLAAHKQALCIPSQGLCSSCPLPKVLLSWQPDSITWLFQVLDDASENSTLL